MGVSFVASQRAYNFALYSKNASSVTLRLYRDDNTSQPFYMTVHNDLDRFHLVIDVIDRGDGLGSKSAYLKQQMHTKLIEHQQYITPHGEDMQENRNWRWTTN